MTKEEIKQKVAESIGYNTWEDIPGLEQLEAENMAMDVFSVQERKILKDFYEEYINVTREEFKIFKKAFGRELVEKFITEMTDFRGKSWTMELINQWLTNYILKFYSHNNLNHLYGKFPYETKNEFSELEKKAFARELVKKFINWLPSYESKGSNDYVSDKIIIIDGEYYFENDIDGDHPLTVDELYELFIKSNNLQEVKEVEKIEECTNQKIIEIFTEFQYLLIFSGVMDDMKCIQLKELIKTILQPKGLWELFLFQNHISTCENN